MINNPLGAVDPSTLPAWQALENAATEAQQRTLSEYFANDSQRHDNFSFSAAALNVDLSRHHVDQTLLTKLLKLAADCGIDEAIGALQSGQTLNFTEGRPALHCQQRLPLNSEHIPPEVAAGRAKIRAICEAVHSGQWAGFAGEAIRDVVNIGIGGSDLGPRMAAQALSHCHNAAVTVHFVANVDPGDLQQVLAPLNPATTLFVVASKSWTTLETLSNASAAKQWIINAAGNAEATSKHFIAVSSRPDACKDFGINPDNILPMQDGVGGRYSLWSAVGLSVALATSAECFEQLLAGANAMDNHFFASVGDEQQHNIPLLLALLEIWYVNFWGARSVAVLPYNHDLRLFPDHLQQLTMESNGKGTNRDGQPVNYQTCPVVWGSAGTIGQHSFHQLLHQGTQLIPVDFILPLNSHSTEQAQHNHLISNCLAQSQALMDGLSASSIEQSLVDDGLDAALAKQLAAHKSIPGNRPSTIISMEKVTPATTGALLALYEHKVFCQSMLWNINAFDQWGVELGKLISNDIYPAVMAQPSELHNRATAASVKAYREILKA
jgi:glucose-6-phosphate isomerase